jgi:hypothetical protein
LDNITNKIILMSEYECSPCWIIQDGIKHNFPLDSMNITEELTQQIQAWDTKFQATLNQDHPPDSGFDSEDELVAFNKEGEALSTKLFEELCPDSTVEYIPFE